MNTHNVKPYLLGESAWVVSAWNVDNQFFCPGTYEEDMSGMTVLQTNADAVYRICEYRIKITKKTVKQSYGTGHNKGYCVYIS